MRDILKLFSAMIWVSSLTYLVSGIVAVIRWTSARVSSPFNLTDIPPLPSMEFPEHAAIAIAIAGIICVFSFRLCHLGSGFPGVRVFTGFLVLIFGAYLMAAKGLVCLFSADSGIAQLHHITFGSVTAMTLSAIWLLIDNSTKTELGGSCNSAEIRS